VLKQIDDGCLKRWNDVEAPEFASNYYSLPKNASFKDVILAIRADEACHGEVNHCFADNNDSTYIEFEETHIQEDVQHLVLQEFEELAKKEKPKPT
jgi:hypothetical protein